jgi:high potential iron-sulfur protein
MSDPAKIPSAEPSRRAILQRFALTAGGAAMLATSVGGVRDAKALSKASQKVVAYQDTPKGAQQCDNCRQFNPPASCKVVDGVVSPTGWCKVYVKKPAA